MTFPRTREECQHEHLLRASAPPWAWQCQDCGGHCFLVGPALYAWALAVLGMRAHHLAPDVSQAELVGMLVLVLAERAPASLAPEHVVVYVDEALQRAATMARLWRQTEAGAGA